MISSGCEATPARIHDAGYNQITVLALYNLVLVNCRNLCAMSFSSLLRLRTVLLLHNRSLASSNFVYPEKLFCRLCFIPVHVRWLFFT